MSELLKRIRSNNLLDKIVEPEETVSLFRDGMYLGFSGFAGGDEYITTGNYEENYLTPTELISWNKQKELINNNDKDIKNEKNNEAILADYIETKL